MSGKNLFFNDEKINKSNFYRKKTFIIDHIDFNKIYKILISKKEPHVKKIAFKFKYSNGYNDDDDDVIRPLCIKLPQMIPHILNVFIVIRQCLLRLIKIYC